MVDGTQAVALNVIFLVQRSETLQARLKLYVELLAPCRGRSRPGEEGQSLAGWAAAPLWDNFQMSKG